MMRKIYFFIFGIAFVTNANQKLEKPDLTKVQERQETAQVIGDLSQSGINRLVGEHLKEANQKRAEAESIAQTDQAKAEILRNEAKAIEAEYGVGSSLQMGIRAATGALQGLATGNSNQAIVGGLSPYANKAIKEATTNADGSINKEANLIAHAVLGAVEAKATGNNALAGATSALTAEASAPYLMQVIYGTDKAENLSDSQKQNIANLSQVVAGLSGGLAGDSTGSVVAGAEIGKRAVENNYLYANEAKRLAQLEQKAIAGTITTEENVEREALKRKDLERDQALFLACEGAILSAGCNSQRKELGQAKFSYSYGENNSVGYAYPSYTKLSNLYPAYYGKITNFSDRYSVLANSKEVANAEFYKATGINPNWFGRVEVANNVVASIAGTRLSILEPNKATQILPNSVTSNEKLPLIGQTQEYNYSSVRLNRKEYNAYSINAKEALSKKLSALENAQKSAIKIRVLPDNRVRYYEKERLARTEGPTRGNSFVTEYNPLSGKVRQWMESYNHEGKVNRVHPKSINGQPVNSIHYPPTKKELEEMK